MTGASGDRLAGLAERVEVLSGLTHPDFYLTPGALKKVAAELRAMAGEQNGALATAQRERDEARKELAFMTSLRNGWENSANRVKDSLDEARAAIERVRWLVGKWREDASRLNKSYGPGDMVIAADRQQCADELTAALAAIETQGVGK